MKVFNKVRYSKKKTILVIFVSLVLILVSFILLMNLNTRFREKGEIEVPAIGSNNKILETNEDKNELSSEHKPRKLFADGSNTFEHTTPPAFKDLQKKYHFILNQQIDHDLLYRYEPYYIIEGWNYEEMYTPEPN